MALLLVGVLTVAVTPSRAPHRDVTATPADAGAGELPASAADAAPAAPQPHAVAATGNVPLGAPADTPPDVPGKAYVVTPVAAGYGLTTRSALTDPDATAQLPTGNAVQLAVLAEVGPVAVVSIPTLDVVPLGVAGPGSQPDVSGERFVVVDGTAVPYAAEPHVLLLEGAPVVNEHGALIGLITYTDAGPEVMAISINDDLAPPLAFLGEVTTPADGTVDTIGAPAPGTSEPVTGADPTTDAESSDTVTGTSAVETSAVDSSSPVTSGELAASDAVR